MAAQQARLEQLEQDYQNALRNFNQQEAQARDHYKKEYEMGIAQGDFPAWTLQNAPAATVAYNEWQSVTEQLNHFRAQMQFPGMIDEQKKQMKRSSKFTGRQYAGISDNPNIEDI